MMQCLFHIHDIIPVIVLLYTLIETNSNGYVHLEVMFISSWPTQSRNQIKYVIINTHLMQSELSIPNPARVNSPVMENPS